MKGITCPRKPFCRNTVDRASKTLPLARSLAAYRACLYTPYVSIYIILIIEGCHMAWKTYIISRTMSVKSQICRSMYKTNSQAGNWWIQLNSPPTSAETIENHWPWHWKCWPQTHFCHNVTTRCKSSKCTKMHEWLEICPGPHWGSNNAPQIP